MSNEQAINAAIQLYFDGMYESDADKVHAVFHPNAQNHRLHGRHLGGTNRSWSSLNSLQRSSPRLTSKPNQFC